ncbi:MAG: hypothetical protein HY924_17185 [Elusimicrobia bacterium]|nr:hypothetical protein [Elusimicrobiota bacterium]
MITWARLGRGSLACLLSAGLTLLSGQEALGQTVSASARSAAGSQTVGVPALLPGSIPGVLPGAPASASLQALPAASITGLGGTIRLDNGLTSALVPVSAEAPLPAVGPAQNPLPASPVAASAPRTLGRNPSLEATRLRQSAVSETLAAEPDSETAASASAAVFEGLGIAGTLSVAAPELSAVSAALAAPSGLGRPVARTAEPSLPLAGKTLLYVVSKVGGRDYLYDHMLAMARETGFELVVLGYPDQKDFAVSRGVRPENYVAADIGNHSPENIARIAAQVRELARRRPIDGVKTFLNAYAQLESELARALSLPGYDPEAVRSAHSKSRARELMNKHPDPALHLPAVLAASEAEAAEAFRRIKAAGFENAVAKPDSGGGGWGVKLGIDSPEAAAAAYREIAAEISRIVREDPRKAASKQLDQSPSVLFEAQIPDGLMLDAEIVVRDGKPVFTFLSYNPPALGNQERGTTYPAALTPEMAALARSQAVKALEAVGLRTGNAHVELIVTRVAGKLAAPIVEINARMGGADIWASVREASGVDVMREGMLAAFGVESRPQPAERAFHLQHRFIISGTAGKLRAVRGLPEQGGEVFLSELFLKPGDAVGANDLLGNITVRGSDELESRDRLFSLLESVEIDIETPDGRLVTQNGLFGHDSADGRLVSGDWVDRLDFAGAGWLGRLKMLPRSFMLGFTPAWTLNAMAQEVQAVALPLFSAALFGLPAALIVTGVGYVMRVAGAWLGSWFMARFNPKWVNVAALVVLALAGLPIPLAAGLGASSSLLFSVFIANSVVQGLVYGINRGVAENLLPRLVIGNHNPEKLELGLNYAYQWVEVACIVMALFVAVPMLSLLGGNVLMVVSSAGIGLSSLLYATLKYREAWAKPKPKAEAASEPSKTESGLGLKDYLPYAFFRFMHFMVYGVLATVLALSVFSSQGAAGTMIGIYDGGSWLASLLATLALLPEKLLGRKGWTLLGAAASVAFVWSALLQVPVLTFVLGGVLGGFITINSNKWMAHYSKSLPQDKYRDLSKWMMTASVAALIPIFAAVSLARIIPAVGAVLTMSNILLGINVLVTVGAAVTALLLLRREKPKA